MIRALRIAVSGLIAAGTAPTAAQNATGLFIRAAAASVGLSLTTCATAPLTQSGGLASYENLKPSNGVLTRTRQTVNREIVLAAKSVMIMPSTTSEQARQSGLSDKQLRLVTNAVDRALCAELSARLEVVTPDKPADLTVQAVVTHVGKTDVAMAGASKVAGIGGAVATVTTGIPVPVPRIPVGMGGLSVEAQASTPQRQQAAAMIWARGADALTTRPRLSEEADAYALATEFSGDFAKLLVTGADPLKNSVPALPTAQSIKETFGGKPKYSACEQFGTQPGLGGALGGAIGLPPDWTDSGSR